MGDVKTKTEKSPRALRSPVATHSTSTAGGAGGSMPPKEATTLRSGSASALRNGLDEIERRLTPRTWSHPGEIDLDKMWYTCCHRPVQRAMFKGCTPSKPLPDPIGHGRTHPGEVDMAGHWTCCKQAVFTRGCTPSGTLPAALPNALPTA